MLHEEKKINEDNAVFSSFYFICFLPQTFETIKKIEVHSYNEKNYTHLSKRAVFEGKNTLL